MPIAVTPINGQRDGFAKRANQRAILIVNGAASIEMIIMFRDFEHTFARNIAAAKNIF